MALTRNKGISFELGTFKVVEQCGVVILDGELSGYETQSRLSPLAAQFGEENQNTPLRIISTEELIDNLDKPVNLDDEDWRNSIYLYMKNNPINKVFIIDNLSSLCGGNSESSRESITNLNRWLFSIRRLGVAIIVIHHSNNAGGQRGHSGKIDNLHTVINLTSLKGAGQVCFKVQYNKGRFAKANDAKEFVVELVQHSENPEWLTWKGYYEEDAESSAPTKDNEIIRYLIENNVKQREIAEHFNVSQSKVSNCRRKAITAGYITKKGEITESGRQFLADQEGNVADEADLGIAA